MKISYRFNLRPQHLLGKAFTDQDIRMRIKAIVKGSNCNQLLFALLSFVSLTRKNGWKTADSLLCVGDGHYCIMQTSKSFCGTFSKR